MAADFINEVFIHHDGSERSEPPKQPQAPTRPVRNYTANVDCIIKRGNYLGAWSVKPPVITSSSGSWTIPDVDLRPEDTINLSSPLCPELNNAAENTVAVTSAKMKFEKIYAFTGGPDQFKWALTGEVQ